MGPPTAQPSPAKSHLEKEDMGVLGVRFKV